MIHSSSVISKKAKIGKNVKIGPFCFVGEFVELEDNVELISNVHIEGNTKIGNGTKIFPFASLGTAPQDLKYNKEPTSLIVGKDKAFAEIAGEAHEILAYVLLGLLVLHIAGAIKHRFETK